MGGRNKEANKSAEARLKVYVQPGAACTEFAGRHGEAVKVRVRAPAREGAANEALIRFLAETFRVPRQSIRILHGISARNKTVCISGRTTEEVERVLGVAVERDSTDHR